MVHLGVEPLTPLPLSPRLSSAAFRSETGPDDSSLLPRRTVPSSFPSATTTLGVTRTVYRSGPLPSRPLRVTGRTRTERVDWGGGCHQALGPLVSHHLTGHRLAPEAEDAPHGPTTDTPRVDLEPFGRRVPRPRPPYLPLDPVAMVRSEDYRDPLNVFLEYHDLLHMAHYRHLRDRRRVGDRCGRSL